MVVDNQNPITYDILTFSTYSKLNFEEYLDGKVNEISGKQVYRYYENGVINCDAKGHITDYWRLPYTLTEDTMFEYSFTIDGYDMITYRYIKDINHEVLYENVSVNVKRKDKVLVNFIRGKESVFTLCGTETLNNRESDNYISLVKYIYKNSSLKNNVENRLFQYMISVINRLDFYEFDYYNDDKLRGIYAKIIKDGRLDKFKTYIKKYAEVDYVITAGYYSCTPSLFFKNHGSSIQLNDSPSIHTRLLILVYDLMVYISNDQKPIMYSLPYNLTIGREDSFHKYSNIIILGHLKEYIDGLEKEHIVKIVSPKKNRDDKLQRSIYEL